MRKHEAPDGTGGLAEPGESGEPGEAPGEAGGDADLNTRPLLSSEAVLSRGHWQASDRTNARAAPVLRWEPSTRIGERIRRGIAVPVTVGALVFVAAVAVAIGITMARGHGVATAGADAAASSSETAGEQPGGGATSGAQSGPVPEHGDGGADASRADVLVHVVGEVHTAGVVELPAGSRVADAIDEAGGATDAAVLDVLNLARTVADGEQLIVPDAALAAAWRANPSGAAGNSAAAGEADTSAAGPSPGGVAGATTGGSGAGTGAGAIALNTAAVADLETLPRIGPALAQRIIDWRDANGGFTSVDQLLEVPGIGAKTLDGLRDLVVL